MKKTDYQGSPFFFRRIFASGLQYKAPSDTFGQSPLPHSHDIDKGTSHGREKFHIFQLICPVQRSEILEHLVDLVAGLANVTS